MALIKCPECKKKISDLCEKCPQCGYPIETTEKPAAAMKEELAETATVEKKERKPKKEKKNPINKKLLIGIISASVALILIFVFTLLGLTHFNETWKDATHNFKVVSNELERMNDELDSLIQKSENLVETKEKALDEEKRAILKGTVADAKKVRKEVSKKPLLAKDIETATSTMEEIDYTEIVKSLEGKYNDFEKSIKQYKLVDNPTEEYLLSRLKTVEGIFNITAYTEETDTNKYLNKAKWYYSKIVFQHEDVKHSAIEYGLSIEEVGNPAGGCVEAFKTVEDAERRNQELQSQEGTARSPGTHKVVGTVLVRTSDELTTTKQKELEQAIIDALTYIEEDSKKEPITEQIPEESKSTPTTSSNTTSNSKPSSNNKGDTEETSSADRNQQAIWTAEEIANVYASVCPNMVKEMLMYEYGYTETQANYGVENADIDWYQYAIWDAESFANIYATLSSSMVKEKLMYENGYTEAQANYGVENADVDWESLAGQQDANT